MSDHDSLDEMFDRMASDVGDHTRAPGAPRAIHAAGRRRQSFAAAAAICVLAASGVVAGVLDGDDSDGRDQRPSDQSGPVQVQAPQELTARALEEATTGWVAGWTGDATPVLTDPPCLSGAGLDDLDPEQLGDQIDLGISSHTGLSAFSVEMPSTITGAEVFKRLSAAIDECKRVPSDTTEFTLSDDDRGSFASWMPADGEAAVSLWIVQHDQVITLVVASGELDVPSVQVQRDMLALGDAKLHWDRDQALAGVPGDSTSPTEAHTALDPEGWPPEIKRSRQVDAASFGRATRSWAQGWEDGTGSITNDPRCLEGANVGGIDVTEAGTPVDLRIGDRAQASIYSVQLDDAATAREVHGRLSKSVDECATAPALVEKSALADRAAVTFASWSADAEPASSLWLVQKGRLITILVTTGDLDQPDLTTRENVAFLADAQLKWDGRPLENN